MAKDNRQQARRVFMEVADLPQTDRAAALTRACGGDARLRAEVEALLRAEEQAGGFMASPTGDAPAASPAPAAATIAATPGEQAGALIGRYKLLERIGEGGFGEVWMAEQREPVKRRVALKIIKLGMDTKQVIARFEAERQALAMMDHPHIAKVLDAGATETGRPFFVMELVKGVPILEYCDKERLDTQARLELFKSVCHAIQHAHQKGIIHRDIKPSNVLVTLHDGVPVPKVIDFGIAKATNAELTSKTLFTEHRQMIGTPAYMSPEQAELSGLDIDTRADIYSLGVLLYELLTGTTPFDVKELMSKGFAEMMRAIREDEPHKPSTRISTLGDTGTRTAQQRHVDVRRLGVLLRGDLDWIVMKCLEKDRSRRYETANGLAADVQRHLSGEPVVAAPPSRAYRLRKFVRRNRTQVIASGVVAAVLVLGVIGTTWGLMWALRQKKLTESADEATRRELARTTEVKRLIAEMLDGVTPEKARGADIRLLKGILDDTSARLAKGEVKDELIAAELHGIVGNVYLSLGLYEPAERHDLAALEIRRRLLGEEHPATLGLMVNLANLHNRRGRYAEAEPLYVKTLEIEKRVLGEAHPDTLGLMGNLASLYRTQGRHAEAEQLSLKTLEIKKRVLGEEHPNTLMSMANLALLYQSQGRYAEAETLFLKTLEIEKRVLGEEHPVTLSSRNNLANLCQSQGRYAEAETLYLKLLEIKKRVLGEEHPDTLASAINLAILYQRQGRYAEAETLLLETLEIQKRVLGEEHPDTVQAMSNLASLYTTQGYTTPGRHAEVAQLCLKALEIKKRVLGEEHPSTLRSMGTLADLYGIQGRYAEAETLFLNTLEIEKRVLRKDHPDTLGFMHNLANMYKRQGRYAEAELLFQKTLEILKRVSGEEHPSTLGTITDLGSLYLAMGRYEDARRRFEESLPIKRRVLGMQHPWTRTALQGLATAYSKLGREDDAAPLERELLELRIVAANGPDADANTLNDLAWTLLTHDLEAVRDPARALVLAQRACERAEAAGGGILWACLDTLALAQHRTGDTAKAIETSRRAISLVPEGTAEATVAGMKANLATFEAALAQNTRPAGEGGDR